jgi:hypothetical protein
VRVEAEVGATELELTTSASTLQEDLVYAVDQALLELRGRAQVIRPPSLAGPAPTELPEPPGLEAATQLPSKRAASAAQTEPPRSRRAATPSERSPAAPLPALSEHQAPFARFSAAASAESWESKGAVGAAFGFAQGEAALWYGLELGGFLAPGVHSAFEVNEWHASLQAGWQPAWSRGVEAVLGFGPSLLVVTPRGAVTTASTNLASSWFGELTLRRPLWFGKLALVPSLGARAFLSERRITLDAREQLGLAGLQPRLSVGLLYRMR